MKITPKMKTDPSIKMTQKRKTTSKTKITSWNVQTCRSDFIKLTEKQQFRFFYKLRMDSSAHDVCCTVLNAIRSSHLDFYLQETPYSAFITIRKKFIKTFQPSKYLSGVDRSVIENLTVENEKLRAEIIEKKAETESTQAD